MTLIPRPRVFQRASRPCSGTGSSGARRPSGPVQDGIVREGPAKCDVSHRSCMYARDIGDTWSNRSDFVRLNSYGGFCAIKSIQCALHSALKCNFASIAPWLVAKLAITGLYSLRVQKKCKKHNAASPGYAIQARL